MNRLVFCIFAFFLGSLSVHAGDAWPDIRAALYDDRILLNGEAYIDIHAERRTKDDARAIIGATLTPPQGDRIVTASLILDNNPAPVSAVFTLVDPVARFAFDATMRVNGPTPLHITFETDTGKIFVAESFVKTSGLGACSAPPGTDIDAALATLGQMVIDFEKGSSELVLNEGLGTLVEEALDSKVRVEVSHPSHSGMQMDQITLLFVPMRAVQTLQIERNERPFMSIEGSISLSENPQVSFSVPKDTYEIGVTMIDTDGTTSQAKKRRSFQ